jgi:hypothetical protein
MASTMTNQIHDTKNDLLEDATSCSSSNALACANIDYDSEFNSRTMAENKLKGNCDGTDALNNRESDTTVTDYKLNNIKLLQRKLAATFIEPLTFEYKGDNFVLECNSAAVETVRQAMMKRFFHEDYQDKKGQYRCEISQKRDTQNLV